MMTKVAGSSWSIFGCGGAVGLDSDLGGLYVAAVGLRKTEKKNALTGTRTPVESNR
ncbi:hypothetical protein BCV70DRAFT_198219 [Testicularia cyperi]|uniref:Uncharacterized protein n=1 Tax=Testicularia cyperi TaxID=1882483 RepID=A0A317XVK6_9BASI|nr:hypothetical protein BCV70DRAFT_198219 [Testicularia cyperi]